MYYLPKALETHVADRVSSKLCLLFGKGFVLFPDVPFSVPIFSFQQFAIEHLQERKHLKKT
jgi:hypothetical protein